LVVVTIDRDLQSLHAEAAMEQLVLS
jgi:hypothetical protein